MATLTACTIIAFRAVPAASVLKDRLVPESEIVGKGGFTLAPLANLDEEPVELRGGLILLVFELSLGFKSQDVLLLSDV